jgi:hypothetical protein
MGCRIDFEASGLIEIMKRSSGKLPYAIDFDT